MSSPYNRQCNLFVCSPTQLQLGSAYSSNPGRLYAHSALSSEFLLVKASSVMVVLVELLNELLVILPSQLERFARVTA